MNKYRVTMMIMVSPTKRETFVRTVEEFNKWLAEGEAIRQLPNPLNQLHREDMEICVEKIDKYMVHLKVDDHVFLYEQEAESKDDACGIVMQNKIDARATRIEEAKTNPYNVVIRLNTRRNLIYEYSFMVLEESEVFAKQVAYSMIPSDILSKDFRPEDVRFTVTGGPKTPGRKVRSEMPNAYHPIEKMSDFEKEILFERYYSAIRIGHIILEKWEESFPEYEYFPTAKLWKKWRLVKTMDAATETYRDKNYCMLKLHIDDLWEYINGGQEEKATTITKLRYSHETIVESILKQLPKANVRFINQGQTVEVAPGDGREPAQFKMDYIQRFNNSWIIGTEIFASFRNRDTRTKNG